MATQVLDRIRRWNSDWEELWTEVLARSTRKKNGERAASIGNEKTEVRGKSSVEKAHMSKTLRILNAAPLAPKNGATFDKLKRLHPLGAPLYTLSSSRLQRF